MTNRYSKLRVGFGGRAICAIALLALGATASMAAQGISSDWDEGAPGASSAPTVSVAPPVSTTASTQPTASSMAPHEDAGATVRVGTSQSVGTGQTAVPVRQTKTGDYPAPTWSSYYASVDSIRADTEKTQAELDNLKIHHALDQARNGVFDQNNTGSTSSPVSPLGGMGMASANAGSSVAQADRSPLVREVDMVDGRWTAVIQLATGARITVHQGETVRSLGKIESIALNDVEVSTGGKTSSLEFSSDGTAEAATTTQGTRTMTPPVPFGMH
jgi:type IV pilus biogenesis protein PilP